MVENESSTPLFTYFSWDCFFQLLFRLFILCWKLCVLFFLAWHELKWIDSDHCNSVLVRTHHKLFYTDQSSRNLKLAQKLRFPISLEFKAEKCSSTCSYEEMFGGDRYTFEFHLISNEEFLFENLNRCYFIIYLHLSFSNCLWFHT